MARLLHCEVMCAFVSVLMSTLVTDASKVLCLLLYPCKDPVWTCRPARVVVIPLTCSLFACLCVTECDVTISYVRVCGTCTQDLHFQQIEEQARPEAIGIVCSYASWLNTWPPPQGSLPDVGIFCLTELGRCEVKACLEASYMKHIVHGESPCNHDDRCGEQYLFDHARHVVYTSDKIVVQLRDERQQLGPDGGSGGRGGSSLGVPSPTTSIAACPAGAGGSSGSGGCHPGGGGASGIERPACGVEAGGGTCCPAGSHVATALSRPGVRSVSLTGIVPLSRGRCVGMAVTRAADIAVVSYAYPARLIVHHVSGSGDPGHDPYRLSELRRIVVGSQPTQTVTQLSFDFSVGGGLRFTVVQGGATPTLLVADGGHDRVVEVNVTTGALVSLLYSPGSIEGSPRCIAASATHIAVSAWKDDKGPHVVHVFDATSRRRLCTLGGAVGVSKGLMHSPLGLCLTRDGLHVAVAERTNSRISVFSLVDGEAVDVIDTPLKPFDIEDCLGGFVIAGGVQHAMWVSHRGPGLVDRVSLGGGRMKGATGFQFGVFCLSKVGDSDDKLFVLDSAAPAVEVRACELASQLVRLGSCMDGTHRNDFLCSVLCAPRSFNCRGRLVLKMQCLPTWHVQRSCTWHRRPVHRAVLPAHLALLLAHRHLAHFS